MLAIIPINNIAFGTLPPERVKNASGLFNLMRNLGGAVGLAGSTPCSTTAPTCTWRGSTTPHLGAPARDGALDALTRHFQATDAPAWR